MTQEDLFALADGPALTPEQRRRLRGRTTKQHGYADRPGTGPQGETCKTCAHIVRGRRYRKCALRRATWTHGYGTDILASAPACKKWQRPEDTA
jgi:hypothetical protein